MRLTDADALKQTFCAECDHSIKCEDCDIDYHFEHLAPTVDAVEVVRCKDCIHRMEDGMCDYKDYRVVAQDDDDFCSWGDRKNETD